MSTSLMASVTTTTASLLVNGTLEAVAEGGIAEDFSEIVFTESLIHALALAVGVIVAFVRRPMPMLLAGNLLLALCLSMLVKSWQEADEHLSQSPVWPIAVTCGVFFSVSGLLCFPKIRQGVVAGLSAVVFAVFGLVLTIAAKQPAFPVGMLVAFVLLLGGGFGGFMLWENPWFHKGLSAVVGAFLVVNATFFLVQGADLALDLARGVARAGTHKAAASAAAEEIQPQVVSWVAAAVCLFFGSEVVAQMWEHYKPNRFRNDEDSKAFSEATEFGSRA